MKIRPAKRLVGTIRVPGDKSISHRAVMLGSIADGVRQITNFAPGRDCVSTIECMRALGVEIDVDGTDVVVHGVGRNGLQEASAPLNCGNSGTTMRLLAGVLAGQSFDSVLTGDESLRARPMNRIIDPLMRMGAVIESNYGFAPLTIRGGQTLKGITFEPPVASAQIKSCVLLAGLYADGETRVIETISTRDHTERMLACFGKSQKTIDVPGDISSAAYFLIAAASLAGSEITLESVGINPTRTRLFDVLKNAAVDITITNEREANNEPSADLRVSRGSLSSGPLTLSGKIVAEVIDELPMLAVLGTQLENGIDVHDASELRVKETDRIAAIVENLRRMKADVTEFDDGFVVGRSNLKGGVVNSFGDHRIAMAFAIAGLLAEGETEIVDAECVDVSYPRYYKDLCGLCDSA